MYKRYTVEEIKRKVIETLQNNDGAGMSSIELANAIHINRMTITKYLNVLATIGLIKRKKIGSVNIWTLESGVADLEFPLNYLQIQQNFINTIFENNRKDTSRLLLSIIYSESESIKIIKEVIVPTLNTINELYNRGKLGKTELISLNNRLFDLVILLEMYHNRIRVHSNINNIFIAGNEDKVYTAKIASVASEIMGCDTLYIGNIEQHIDPFFDIDLQRYVTRSWNYKKGIKIIHIHCSDESSLKFLFTTAEYLKRNLTDNIQITLFVNQDLMEQAKSLNPDFITSDITSMITWIEGLSQEQK